MDNLEVPQATLEDLLSSVLEHKRIEDLKLYGSPKLTLIDKDGVVKDVRKYPNLIVKAGKDLISNCTGKSTGQPAGAQYVAIGTGTASPTADDTQLGAEVARGLATYAHTAGQNTWTETYTFGAGQGTGGITESGVLNAASLGSLLSRQVFSVINKGGDDSLQVQWTYTIS